MHDIEQNVYLGYQEKAAGKKYKSSKQITRSKLKSLTRPKYSKILKGTYYNYDYLFYLIIVTIALYMH